MLRDQLHLIFLMIPACIQGILFTLLSCNPKLIRTSAKVSLDRITEYLNDTELLDEYQNLENHTTEPIEELSVAVGPKDPEAIGVSNASFVWSSVDGSLTPSRRKFRLTIDDELIFKRSGINLIIGPTGSGKTSLLMALLGIYVPACLLVLLTYVVHDHRGNALSPLWTYLVV